MNDAPMSASATTTTSQIQARRDLVFLVLAGLFLGTLGMLNILGLTRFLALGQIGSFPIVVAVGALPYPVTFLCTDLISELWGEERATQVVWVGLLLNGWVVLILWIGGLMPGLNGAPESTFFEIQRLAFRVRRGIDGGLPHGPIRRRALVPLLEGTHEWQGPLAPQQRLHLGEPVGGYECRGVDQPLRRPCVAHPRRGSGASSARSFYRQRLFVQSPGRLG